MLNRFTINTITALLIVGALIFQTIRIEGLRIWPVDVKGLKEQVSDRDRTIAELTKPKNEQKQTTERNIDQAERGNREADRVAERIEEAPLPGECKTPDAILGADL